MLDKLCSGMRYSAVVDHELNINDSAVYRK